MFRLWTLKFQCFIGTTPRGVRARNFACNASLPQFKRKTLAIGTLSLTFTASGKLQIAFESKAYSFDS
jgi:hypothetical protein